MPDIQSFLKSLGLTKKERELYLASLKYGPQTASTLAQKTGIARSTVNFVFNELIKKGFASKNIEEKTTYFSAIQPELIEYILLKKAAKTKKLIQDYKELLPSLEDFQNTFSTTTPTTRYFEGIEGIRRLIDDNCRKDETVLFISGHNNMMDPRVQKYITDIYIPISKKHKNKNKMIIQDGEQARAFAKKAEGVYDEITFIDPEKYPLSITTAIYGDRISLSSSNPKDMSGILIKNQLVANHMRTIFNILKEHFQNETP